MGQCGCGDFNADFKFPGPEGITYVLQVYPPCEYCDTPAGIILYAMEPDDCSDWDVAELPNLDIQDIGTMISIVHPKKIMQSVVDGIEAYIEEGVKDNFRNAVFNAIKDNKKIHATANSGGA